MTGGGLRTGQLIETLRAGKHSVVPVIERAALPDGEAPHGWRSFDEGELPAVLRAIKPQVLVLEQWALAALLGDPAEGGARDVPLVIDLHGSLLLENVYRRGAIDLTMDAKTKLEALRRADLLLTPAAAQLHHFASWASLAGFDPRELPLALMPLATGRVGVPRSGAEPALRMVYGGARWPWIDSLGWLEVAARVAEAHRSARLDVFAYEPPRHGLPFEEDLGSWPDVDAALGGRTREGVRLRGGADHADYVAFLESEATVALDLWEPNPERMLAATTRTIEFLAAGLPVITLRGAAWAEELVQSGAGWTVADGDREGLRALLDELARHPERIASASEAALGLARQRSELGVSGRALLEFVDKPSRPPREPRSIVEAIVHVRQQHLDETLRSHDEAHRREHEALVAAHKAETARMRAEHDAQVVALREERRAEVSELRAAADAQVALMTQRHRDEIDALRTEALRSEAARQAELGDARAQLAARARELKEATEERDALDGKLTAELAREREARRTVEAELRAALDGVRAELAKRGAELKAADEARDAVESELGPTLAAVRAELETRGEELRAATEARDAAETELRTELAVVRAELETRGEELRAATEERDARVGELTEQLTRETASLREALESMRTELETRSGALKAMTEARDQLEGRWRADRAQDKEARTRLEVELRAKLTSREEELRAVAAREREALRAELQAQLEAMAARKVVRLADAVQSSLGGADGAGVVGGLAGRIVGETGRVGPAARLLKLWAEHALDREHD